MTAAIICNDLYIRRENGHFHCAMKVIDRLAAAVLFMNAASARLFAFWRKLFSVSERLPSSSVSLREHIFFRKKRGKNSPYQTTEKFHPPSKKIQQNADKKASEMHTKLELIYNAGKYYAT